MGCGVAVRGGRWSSLAAVWALLLSTAAASLPITASTYSPGEWREGTSPSRSLILDPPVR